MKKDTSVIIIFLLVIILILGYLLLNKNNNKGDYYSYDQINNLIDQRINENNQNNLPIVPEKKADEIKPKPFQQKPTVVTMPATNIHVPELCPPGGNCPPSIYPAGATLNGSFNGNGAKVTTWYEYWTANGSNAGVKKLSDKIVQTNLSGDQAQEVFLEMGYGYNFRFVTQNSAGITYGETLQFGVPIP